MADRPSREYMVRGGRLSFHVVEWGEPGDPPVLMLHGRSANAISWHRLAEALSDRYRAVAFDQRGHGLSDWPGRYSDRLLVADVARVVEAVGLIPFALIGHSMGAAIGWEYAARHIDMVSCLILLDGTPDPPGEAEAYEPYPSLPPGLRSSDEIVQWASEQGWTEGLDASDADRWLTHHARFSPGRGWNWGYDEARLDDAYASGRMWQSTAADWRDIERITCPTLVVAAENGVGRELGQLTADRLRQGSVEVIPNTGHLVHWQDLRSTLAAVRPFLDACPSKTSGN